MWAALPNSDLKNSVSVLRVPAKYLPEILFQLIIDLSLLSEAEVFIFHAYPFPSLDTFLARISAFNESFGDVTFTYPFSKMLFP